MLISRQLKMQFIHWITEQFCNSHEVTEHAVSPEWTYRQFSYLRPVPSRVSYYVKLMLLTNLSYDAKKRNFLKITSSVNVRATCTMRSTSIPRFVPTSRIVSKPRCKTALIRLSDSLEEKNYLLLKQLFILRPFITI